MSEEKLGPMPEPQVEPAPENPGGADAINDDVPFSGDDGGPYGRDLDPNKNPEVEEHVPDEITQPDDDKKQEPDEDSGTSGHETEEPPA